METTEIKLTVSEDTKSYIKCLQKLDELWECVYNALELNYGWKSAEEIMRDEFSGNCNAVRVVVNSYMCASIDNH